MIGSVVTAENDLGIFAERDVNLVPGRESDQSEYIKKKTSVGMSNSWSESGLSSFVGVTKQESGQKFEGQYSAGSYVGGGNDVVIEAQRDVNQIGSHIEAGRDVVVSAGQDWNMLASYDHENLHEWHKTIQAGLSLHRAERLRRGPHPVGSAGKRHGRSGWGRILGPDGGERGPAGHRRGQKRLVRADLGFDHRWSLLLTHRLPRAFRKRQPVHGHGRARRVGRGRA